MNCCLKCIVNLASDPLKNLLFGRPRIRRRRNLSPLSPLILTPTQLATLFYRQQTLRKEPSKVFSAVLKSYPPTTTKNFYINLLPSNKQRLKTISSSTCGEGVRCERRIICPCNVLN